MMSARGDQSDWEAAIAQLILDAERSVDTPTRIDRLQRAAEIYESEMREPEKAFDVWQAAFVQDFTNERSAKALERLAGQRGDGAQLAAHVRTLLPEAAETRQRAALLAWVGRWLARFTEDRAAAEAHLLEALRLDPGMSVASSTLRTLSGENVETTVVTSTRSSGAIPAVRMPVEGDAGPLHGKLDVLVDAGRWTEAVDVLKALSQSSDGEMRSKYLTTAGKILHHKLSRDEAAIDLFNKALDAYPDDLGVFDRIYQILAGRRAWRDVETNLLRMISRFKEDDAAERAPSLETLWRRLGDVYRVGLRDLPSAANAYEMCVRLAPQDPRYPKILADIAERRRS
jgi:tetratricopeptide (TPR) repeat protein